MYKRILGNAFLSLAATCCLVYQTKSFDADEGLACGPPASCITAALIVAAAVGAAIMWNILYSRTRANQGMRDYRKCGNVGAWENWVYIATNTPSVHGGLKCLPTYSQEGGPDAGAEVGRKQKNSVYFLGISIPSKASSPSICQVHTRREPQRGSDSRRPRCTGETSWQSWR